MTYVYPVDIQGGRMFVVELSCCGRDDGYFGPVPWVEADAFREAYCSGLGVFDPTHPEHGGHKRAGIIVADNTESYWPIPIWRYGR